MTKEMGIYTIFDRIAGANQLMVLANDAMAKRLFSDNVSAPDRPEKPNYIKAHAEDFVLCKLGYINNQTGEIRGEYEEILEACDILKNSVEAQNETREETGN